jgi:hypothetical protein
MADAFSLPMAEIAALLSEGKLKARTLVEEAIANHARFGAKLMAYSQWAPEHARKCADAADAAFAVGSRAGSLQGIPTRYPQWSRRLGSFCQKWESDCRYLKAQLSAVSLGYLQNLCSCGWRGVVLDRYEGLNGPLAT